MATRFALATSLMCGLLLQGCDGSEGIVLHGSGGNGGSGRDVPLELRVVRTSPQDGEESVALDASVSAELDGELDSLEPFDLMLELRDEHGERIPGNVSLDLALNQVVFTPNEPFALELGYTATINRRFEGLDEEDGQPGYSWGFEARDGQWSETLGLGAECDGSDSKARLAMTANGDAVAAWGVRSGFDYVCSQTFDPARGWGTAFRHPDSGERPAVSNVEVAIDSSRNVVIASRQTVSDGPDLSANRHVDIYAATFDAEQGQWENAQRLDPLDLGTNPPEVVIDDAGQATVVWQGVDGSGIPVWVSRYSSGAGWTEAELLIDNPWVARSPAIAVDDSGEVFLTASQFCALSRCIVTRSFAEGFGWTELVPINPDASTYSEDPVIAMSSAGQAAVVWHQAETNSYSGAQRAPSDIWASHLTPELGWSAPVLLEVEPGDISPPHVAIDELGNAIAVWGQHDDAWSELYASRFTSAEGWSAAEPISERHLGDTLRARVALDPTGRAIAVWEQAMAGKEVWVNRFTPKRGWGEPKRVDDGISLQTDVEPQIVIDTKGRALMVWTRGSVRARRFE